MDLLRKLQAKVQAISLNMRGEDDGDYDGAAAAAAVEDDELFRDAAPDPVLRKHLTSIHRMRENVLDLVDVFQKYSAAMMHAANSADLVAQNCHQSMMVASPDASPDAAMSATVSNELLASYGTTNSKMKYIAADMFDRRLDDEIVRALNEWCVEAVDITKEIDSVDTYRYQRDVAKGQVDRLLQAKATAQSVGKVSKSQNQALSKAKFQFAKDALVYDGLRKGVETQVAALVASRKSMMDRCLLRLVEFQMQFHGSALTFLREFVPVIDAEHRLNPQSSTAGGAGGSLGGLGGGHSPASQSPGGGGGSRRTWYDALAMNELGRSASSGSVSGSGGDGDGNGDNDRAMVEACKQLEVEIREKTTLQTENERLRSIVMRMRNAAGLTSPTKASGSDGTNDSSSSSDGGSDVLSSPLASSKSPLASALTQDDLDFLDMLESSPMKPKSLFQSSPLHSSSTSSTDAKTDIASDGVTTEPTTAPQAPPLADSVPPAPPMAPPLPPGAAGAGSNSAEGRLRAALAVAGLDHLPLLAPVSTHGVKMTRFHWQVVPAAQLKDSVWLDALKTELERHSKRLEHGRGGSGLDDSDTCESSSMDDGSDDDDDDDDDTHDEDQGKGEGGDAAAVAGVIGGDGQKRSHKKRSKKKKSKKANGVDVAGEDVTPKVDVSGNPYLRRRRLFSKKELCRTFRAKTSKSGRDQQDAATADSSDRDRAAEEQAKLLAASAPQLDLIDAKRSYNCAIGLARFKQQPEELARRISVMDDTFTLDDLSQLVRLLPTQEEMEVVAEYAVAGDVSLLGPVERWFLQFSRHPRLYQSLKLNTFMQEFPHNLRNVEKGLEIVERAYQQLVSSAELKHILNMVLDMGNIMNSGTAKGQAFGFAIDALSKLRGVKSVDNETTLLHYLVRVLQVEYPDIYDRFQDGLAAVPSAARVEQAFITAEVKQMKQSLDQATRFIASSPQKVKTRRRMVVTDVDADGQSVNADGTVAADGDNNDDDDDDTESEATLAKITRFGEYANARYRVVAARLEAMIDLMQHTMAYYCVKNPTQQPWELLFGVFALFLAAFASAVEDIRIEQMKVSMAESGRRTAAALKAQAGEIRKSKMLAAANRGGRKLKIASSTSSPSSSASSSSTFEASSASVLTPTAPPPKVKKPLATLRDR